MNKEDELLINKVAEEAQYMDWPSFSNSVSRDINFVKREINSLKESNVSELKLIRQEIQSVAPLGNFYKDILLVILAVALGYWLNNLHKKRNQPPPET